ncbi:MAG TPA: hypothetical protein VFV67_23475 [Actinophytocola sp.]|uniref:hypothetical protein n=1 Tax=Actinophytocola sp. TaxID=1872138 RepID=UPI002DBDE310|nr:hypothetical protein [Actinophytocola sp.]HEU5473619.1 hypothetical protein [Actinophytocola sp.]
MIAKLCHEGGQKGCGGLVGDLAVTGEQLRRVPDVGLGGGHLPGIAEAEHRQSMAFLNPPGIERLYSGVTNCQDHDSDAPIGRMIRSASTVGRS